MATRGNITSSIDEHIKILENSNKMLRETLLEVALNAKLDVLKASFKRIQDAIYENEQDIDALKRLKKDDKKANELRFYKNPRDLYKHEEIIQPKKCTVLENGVVGKISGYSVYEPIPNNRFTVKFPDELGILETDVLSVDYRDKLLYIKIRNNVKLPIFKIDELSRQKSFNLGITVNTLDPTGVVLYKTHFHVTALEYAVSPWDYSSNESQTIDLYFDTPHYIITNPEKEKTHKEWWKYYE